MAEKLADHYPPSFMDAIFAQLEAPIGPDRIDEYGEFIPGEKLWESGLRLSDAQRAPMLCPTRFVQDAGGIRSGKSLRGGLRLLLDILWRTQVRDRKDDLYGVVAITYELATETMRHLDRMLLELGIPHDMKTPEGRPWVITFPMWDTTVRTMTASDVAKIAGRSYRGIVMTETNQCPAPAWTACRNRVSQSRGWVYCEGTFESQEGGPWYAQMWEDWQKEGATGVSFSVPSWENRVIYPGGREDPEILSAELDNAPDVFLEKFGGRPIKRSDLVMKYADEAIHVAHLFPALGTSFDPDRPVYLFSDPGLAHAYAVFAVQFWRASLPGTEPGTFIPAPRAGGGNLCWVIDVVYRWGRSVQEIVAECAARPWAWNAEMAIMDVAAKQRRTEGDPVTKQWSEHWFRLMQQQIAIHTQPVPLHAGYDIHKLALLNSWPEERAQRSWNSDGQLTTVTNPAGPRLMFDPQAAAPLFGGLVDGQRYAGEYNIHRNKKGPDGTILRDDPVDTDNDAIKALNYGLFWHFGSSGEALNYIGTNSMPWRMSVA